MIDVYEGYTTPLNGIIAEQLVSNSSEIFGKSVGFRFLAQSFIASADCTLNGIFIMPDVSSGTYTANVLVEILSNNNGIPGTVIAQATIQNATWEASAGIKLFAPFTGHQSLTKDEKYWVELVAVTPSNTNHPNVKTSGSANYGDFIPFELGAWQSPIDDSLYFRLCGDMLPDCLTDDQKQNIKGLLTESCGCCGCDDLPQKSI